MDAWTTLGVLDGDMPAGSMRAFELDADLAIAAARLDSGELVAFGDTCTHEECSLSEGDLEGRAVVCYCHNAKFDLETGAVMRGPAEDPIRVYEVRLVDGELQVRLEGGGDGRHD
jgi:nitrite reductase/ring-hydroxylating ferredoxin subunit